MGVMFLLNLLYIGNSGEGPTQRGGYPTLVQHRSLLFLPFSARYKQSSMSPKLGGGQGVVHSFDHFEGNPPTMFSLTHVSKFGHNGAQGLSYLGCLVGACQTYQIVLLVRVEKLA